MAMLTKNGGGSEGSSGDNIDLELMVRVAHRHYLNARIEGGDKSNTLNSLTMAAEMYRKHGPTCTREQWRSRFGNGHTTSGDRV